MWQSFPKDRTRDLHEVVMLQSCRMSECLWNGRITAYNAISRETSMKWRSDVRLLYIFPKSLVCVKPILALPKQSDPHLGGSNDVLTWKLNYGMLLLVPPALDFLSTHRIFVVVLFVCELITSPVVWSSPRRLRGSSYFHACFSCFTLHKTCLNPTE